MTKKDFSDGFSKLLGDSKPKEKDKKEKQTPKKEPTPKDSPQEDINPEVRATYIVRQRTVEKLKDISYWERAMLKEIVQEALEYYIGAWEKQNGPVEPRKKKKSRRSLKKESRLTK